MDATLDLARANATIPRDMRDVLAWLNDNRDKVLISPDGGKCQRISFLTYDNGQIVMLTKGVRAQ